jgi:protein CLEC16A
MQDEVVSFPLYSEAIKFFHHEEGMVRIAVRTITLSVYNVDDASIRKFVMSPQVVGYFENLITFLRQQMLNLDGLVMEAARLVISSSVLLFLFFYLWNVFLLLLIEVQ